MPKASSYSPLQAVEGGGELGGPAGCERQGDGSRPGSSSPRCQGTQRSIARGFPVALESSQVDLLLGGPRPPQWWRRRPGRGHGADAPLPCFVSSLVSNAENALTAKRTSGSDPVKMRPGVLFVAGFVSKEDFLSLLLPWKTQERTKLATRPPCCVSPTAAAFPHPLPRAGGPGTRRGAWGEQVSAPACGFVRKKLA